MKLFWSLFKLENCELRKDSQIALRKTVRQIYTLLDSTWNYIQFELFLIVSMETTAFIQLNMLM